MKGPVFAAVISAAAALQQSSASSQAGYPSSSQAGYPSSSQAGYPSSSQGGYPSSSHTLHPHPTGHPAAKPFELKVVAPKEADLKGTYAGEMKMVNPALHEPLMPAPSEAIALVKQTNQTAGQPQSSQVLKFNLVNGELQIVTSEGMHAEKNGTKTYVTIGKPDKNSGMAAVNVGPTPAKGFHMHNVTEEHHSSSSPHGYPTTMMTSTKGKPSTTHSSKMPMGTGDEHHKKHHVAVHNETGHQGTWYACPAPVAHPLPTAEQPKEKRQVELEPPSHLPVPVEGHNLYVHFGQKAARNECKEIKLEIQRNHHHKHQSSSQTGYPTQTSLPGFPSQSGYPTHSSLPGFPSQSSESGFPSQSSESGMPTQSSQSGGYPTHSSQSGYPSQSGLPSQSSHSGSSQSSHNGYPTQPTYPAQTL